MVVFDDGFFANKWYPGVGISEGYRRLYFLPSTLHCWLVATLRILNNAFKI
jgi:hypothetical protein